MAWLVRNEDDFILQLKWFVNTFFLLVSDSFSTKNLEVSSLAKGLIATRKLVRSTDDISWNNGFDKITATSALSCFNAHEAITSLTF